MERTVGKNTLGDNQKMKVELHDYERSTQDLGFIWRNTQTVGTLVPFMSMPVQRGDSHPIEIEANVLTHPTVGPLFGSFKFQADIFMCPIRLYNSFLHNNKLGIGMDMSRIKLPVIEVQISKWDTPYQQDNSGAEHYNQMSSQINPSCILSYLGLNGYGVTTTEGKLVRKNAVPLIAYWDIFKNYYANKQEEKAYYMGGYKGFSSLKLGDFSIKNEHDNINKKWENQAILEIFHTLNRPLTETELITTILRYSEYESDNLPSRGWQDTGITSDMIVMNESQHLQIKNNWNKDIYLRTIRNFPKERELNQFYLDEIDNTREEILFHRGEEAWIANKYNKDGGIMPIYELGIRQWEKYDSITDHQYYGQLNSAIPQFGLGLKTYNSDLFNNWIATEWVDQITQMSAVATSTGSFTIDALNMAQKIYAMYNRIAVSGGSYQDWLETVYTDRYFQKTETPIYVGGMSQEIIFQEVISTAASTDEPLGTLAGRGKLHEQTKKGGHIKVKVDEPSYLIGICSITPRLDYSQGNQFDTGLETLDDFHKPALDGIGFEDLTLDKMWWGAKNVDNGTVSAIGKQPAWINYKTNYNRTHGNFAAGEDEAFMVMNRAYTVDKDNGKSVEDVTTYIDPTKYNHIFADESLDAMNFWVQIGIKDECRRIISASNMPNL